MGTLVASAIIAQLRVTLLDPAPGTTWIDAMLLGYISSAERAACLLRPEIYTERAAVDLVAGVEQQLPSGSTALLRAERNVASGRVCRLVDFSLVEAGQPFWPAATEEVDATDYAVDPRDRTRFRVLPPNDGTGQLMVFRGLLPPELDATTDAINLGDEFEDPIKQFALGECYAANTKRQDLAKAGNARGEFARMLGINAQSLAALLPRIGAQQPGVN
jgi:hypothetical protein